MSGSEGSGGIRQMYENLFSESPSRQMKSEEIKIEEELKEDFIVKLDII